MPMSTDISLPKSVEPIFPDRCVACGCDDPDDFYRVGTNAIGWWTLAFWSFGPRFSAKVPACEQCCRKMVRQRWVRLAICLLFVLIGVGVAITVLGSLRGFKRWLGMGVALLCMLPWIAFETIFPPVIDLTATATTVNYEFRDADYAEEFLALNEG